MKKTNRNQNMPDQEIRNNDGLNSGSIQKQRNLGGKKERFRDSNLNQSGRHQKGQRYDDNTGTVQNGIG